MTPKSLSIDGGRYISTKEAAALTGYTSDYIGQLARGNKFKSTLVGKVRLVDKKDIIKYVHDNGNGKTKEHIAHVSDRREDTVLSNISADEKVKSLAKASSLQMNDGVHVGNSFSNKDERKSLSITYVNPVVLGVLAIVIVVTVYSLLFTTIKSFESNTVIAEAFRESIPASTNSVREYATSLYCSITNSLQRFGVHGCTSKKTIISENLKENREGFVVLPSSNVESTDEEIKTQIQEMFSDEVRVAPNEDGVSGVVQPIFRETSGQEYVYVLVPVSSN